MTIDEIRIGQRVRVAPSSTTGDSTAENGSCDGSVVAINRATGQVEVEPLGHARSSELLSISPERLEPIEESARTRTDPRRQAKWWERVVAAGASIPEEERAEIPRDAA